jgi:hypothetical protein
MFDGVNLTGLGDLGPVGVLTLVVLMILFGLLVPRWQHNQRIADKDKVNETLQKALDKRDEQVDKLIEGQELMARLLEDIKRVTELRRSGGDRR